MANKFPVEVMSTGVWNGTKFTLEDLKEMVKNFSLLKRVITPPLKLGHTKDETGTPAYGWVDSLKLVGNKLVATLVDVPELLLKAIRSKRYRRVSSEIFFDYAYGGKKYGRVFSALALLGAEVPAVKDLEDLQAFLSQNSEKGTFGKMVAFDSLSDITLTEEGEMDMDSKILEAQLKDFSDKLALVIADNSKLKAANDALASDKKKSEAKRFTEKCTAGLSAFKAFCDDKVKAGKMLPAQRDVLIKSDGVQYDSDGELVFSLDKFKGHTDLAEKVLDKNEYAATDGGSAAFADVQEEVVAKAEELIEKSGDKNFSAAVDKVLRKDTDLAKRYAKDFADKRKED